jgi:hypothetical protein
MAEPREAAKDLLLFGASSFNRRLTEMWEMLQLGLGAAFIAASVLTRRHSRFLTVSAILMSAIVTVEIFVLTPALHDAVHRVLIDPAAVDAREKLGRFRALHMVFEGAKALIGIAAGFRLVVNWRSWRSVLATEVAPAVPATRRGDSRGRA